MDGQVTAGTLVCAIPKRSMGDWLMKRLTELRQCLAEVTGRLLKPGMNLRTLMSLSNAWKCSCVNWLSRFSNGVSIRSNRRKWKQCRSRLNISGRSTEAAKRGSEKGSGPIVFGMRPASR